MTVVQKAQRLSSWTQKIFYNYIPVYVKRNKRPMGLDALLENQLGHLPKFQKLHIYSLSTLVGRT